MHSYSLSQFGIAKFGLNKVQISFYATVKVRYLERSRRDSRVRQTDRRTYILVGNAALNYY